jgi:hypothetical protein
MALGATPYPGVEVLRFSSAAAMHDEIAERLKSLGIEDRLLRPTFAATEAPECRQLEAAKPNPDDGNSTG